MGSLLGHQTRDACVDHNSLSFLAALTARRLHVDEAARRGHETQTRSVPFFLRENANKKGSKDVKKRHLYFFTHLLLVLSRCGPETWGPHPNLAEPQSGTAMVLRRHGV